MPKTAIISDIHANFDALYAVIKDCREQQCTEVVCLGDIVGYGAYPAECLEYIKNRNCHVVVGNHDEAVVNNVIPRMNEDARKALEWTKEQLTPDQQKWLKQQSYMRIIRQSHASTYSIVHSCLDQPKAWSYIINANDASSHFQKQFTTTCFHGHTHIPKVFTWDGKHADEDTDATHQLYIHGVSEFMLRPGVKYFINVGSVGQPRDHDPRACYAIFDTETQLVTLRRVVYDIAAAQKAILERGLPESLAERLAHGL